MLHGIHIPTKEHLFVMKLGKTSCFFCHWATSSCSHQAHLGKACLSTGFNCNGKNIVDFITYFFSLVTFSWKWMQTLTLYIQALHIYLIHICMYVCTYAFMYVCMYMKSLMHRCGRNVGDQNAHRKAYRSKRLCLVRFQSGSRPILGNVLETICVTFC